MSFGGGGFGGFGSGNNNQSSGFGGFGSNSNSNNTGRSSLYSLRHRAPFLSSLSSFTFVGCPGMCHFHLGLTDRDATSPYHPFHCAR
jgi:hypothetical protein